MNAPRRLLAGLALLLAGCELLEPGAPLDAGEMAVSYRKDGGWIHTHDLQIHPDGRAVARVIGHGSGRTVDSAAVALPDAQRRLLSALFAGFDDYRRSYRPERFLTDQDHDRVVLVYRGRADTVDVEAPARARLPAGLRQILAELERLHRDLLEP